MKKRKLLDISLFVIFAALLVTVISFKSSYHIDEFYSFNLSNHFGISGLKVEDNIRYEPYKDVFYEYSTVSKDNRFNVINVWNNQKNDVHPPLYYWLFNFACSIFYGSFSKWYPGIINIILALITFYFIRKIIKLFIDDYFILSLISVVYIFTTGILDDVAFFRMYELGMLWTTILTYLFVKQIKEPKGKEFYLPSAIVTCLGALTHYYCIVYAFFISVVYGFYLIIKKEGKNLLYFCLSMICSGIVAILIFPPMITHMFFGYHGTESIDNIVNFSDFTNRVVSFFNNTSNEIFGNKWLYVIGLVILLFVIVMIRKNKKLKDLIKDEYIIVLLPCFLYFILVSKIAAYLSERYVSLIHPVLLTITLIIICKLIKEIVQNKYYKAIVIGLSVLLLASGYYYADWFYLFRDTKALNEESKKYNNTDCICIHDDSYFVTEVLYNSVEFMNYNSLTLLNQNNIDVINDYIKSDDVIIKILKIEDNEILIEKIRGQLPQYSNCDLIGNARNGYNYHLY